MALQKATLTNVSVAPPVTVEVQFNPTEYGIDRGASYAELPVPGLGGPILQFVRGEAATLSLESFLDGTAGRGSPVGPGVDEKLAELRRFVLIDGTLHSPPVCEFAWGKVTFRGVVTAFKEKYALFDDAGRALRARVTVALKEYTPPEVEAKQVKRNSPDRTHVRVVRAGDRLDRIAADVYGNPRLWRPIAAANGLDDPRALTPGQALRIPAL